MTTPPKGYIVGAISLAVVCCVGVLAVFWYQLHQSAQILIGKDTISNSLIQSISTEQDEDYNGADVVLLSIKAGDTYALRGQWKEAQDAYEKAVDARGGMVALRKLAHAQIQRRDLSGAKRSIAKLRTAGSRDSDVLLLELAVAIRKGELLEAQKLLNATDDSPQKHYGLALLSLIQGLHEQAQQELQLVEEGWDPALRAKARTLQSAYSEFLLFPEGTNAHLVTLLSRALAQVQECELALPLLSQVTQTSPRYRDAWIVQGFCELTTERAGQALLSLETAYSLDPQKAEIQYFLAKAHSANGEHSHAISFLQFALQNGFSPEDEVRTLLAEEALATNQPDLALQQYATMLDAKEPSVDTIIAAVRTALSVEQLQTAIAFAEKGVSLYKEKARIWESLGDALSAAGQGQQAIAAYDTALEINPYNAKVAEKKRALESN